MVTCCPCFWAGWWCVLTRPVTVALQGTPIFYEMPIFREGQWKKQKRPIDRPIQHKRFENESTQASALLYLNNRIWSHLRVFSPILRHCGRVFWEEGRVFFFYVYNIKYLILKYLSRNTLRHLRINFPLPTPKKRKQASSETYLRNTLLTEASGKY